MYKVKGLEVFSIKREHLKLYIQHIERIYLDCDSDTILYLVNQEGVACHRNKRTCFTVWKYYENDLAWNENQKRKYNKYDSRNTVLVITYLN